MCVHVCMCVHVFVCVCVCLCVFIYIYIYIYIELEWRWYRLKYASLLRAHQWLPSGSKVPLNLCLRYNIFHSSPRLFTFNFTHLSLRKPLILHFSRSKGKLGSLDLLKQRQVKKKKKLWIQTICIQLKNCLILFEVEDLGKYTRWISGMKGRRK